MQTFDLDAARWQGFRDIYAALLPVLGAPDWHGPNLDALFDGLSGVDALQPPFTIVVRNADVLDASVLTYLHRMIEVFDDARREFGREMYLVIA